MGVRRIIWIRNISLMFIMFISSSVLFIVYILTLSCCAGVINPDLSPHSGHTSRVVLMKDGDEDESRYQQVLDQAPEDAREYGHFRRKPLIEEETHPYHLNYMRDTHVHRSHGRRHRDEQIHAEHPEESTIGVKYNDNDEDSMESNVYQEYDVDINRDNKRNRTRKYKGIRTHQKASRKLPQAIIIGVKKGGTRALLEYLRIHPSVRAPGPESHFFDRKFDNGLEWYRRQMPPTYDGQLTMEKTPSYFVTKGVPGRIYNMSKNVKFIVVVRDPVTRAISDYTQALAKRNDIDTFEEMAFENNSTGLVDTSWGAIRIGVYAKHLERWLQYFPLSQMHFVSGEKLITDPAGVMEKVQDFLGISRSITTKNFYFSSTKGFPCLLRTPGGSARKPHCLGKTKGREHPHIEPKVITRLRDFFRPFNQKFYQMVGEDFGWS